MQLLTLENIRETYGLRLSRAHAARLVKAGQLPQPLKLGDGRSARRYWPKNEVEAWLQTRLDARKSRRRYEAV